MESIMLKNNRTFRTILAALTVLAGLAVAGSTKRGSETKGRNYFRQTCKECHTKGAKGGEVSPLTKTQAQWRIYFEKGKHAGGTEALTRFMPDDRLLDVQTFVINHAADSPQPETCGK
jgi:mono/diheme cytochrome c family protein